MIPPWKSSWYRGSGVEAGWFIRQVGTGAQGEGDGGSWGDEALPLNLNSIKPATHTALLGYVNPMPNQTASMQDVARAAGVSLMTVSRALRNAPKVSEATRERVLVCAQKLGYTTDPNLSRMMHAVRGRKRPRSHATIAVVRDHVADDGLLGPAYQ